MSAFGFGKHQRLRTSAEFRSVFDRRCSVGNSWFVMYANANGLTHARLGLSVSRKFGNAVHRNRFKRLTREAFRLSQDKLPNDLDLVIVPRPGAKPTLVELCEALIGAANHLRQRLGRKPNRC